MKKRSGRNGFIFLCAAPAVILFTVFMVIPTINVFRMSLFKRSAYSTTEDFVGLDNFTRLLKDTNFIRSMQNTILLIVVVTIITFGFALVFAAILTREKIKGIKFSGSFSISRIFCRLWSFPLFSAPSMIQITVR